MARGCFAATATYIWNMEKLIVWHDGGCPLCRKEIAFIRRLDRSDAIQFVDLTDSQTNCPINRDEMLKRFHASENGVLLSGAAAFAAMWRAVPLLRPLGLAARIPGILPLLECSYRIFLRFRPALQRLVSGERA